MPHLELRYPQCLLILNCIVFDNALGNCNYAIIDSTIFVGFETALILGHCQTICEKGYFAILPMLHLTQIR